MARLAEDIWGWMEGLLPVFSSPTLQHLNWMGVGAKETADDLQVPCSLWLLDFF